VLQQNLHSSMRFSVSGAVQACNLQMIPAPPAWCSFRHHMPQALYWSMTPFIFRSWKLF